MGVNAPGSAVPVHQRTASRHAVATAVTRPLFVEGSALLAGGVVRQTPTLQSRAHGQGSCRPAGPLILPCPAGPTSLQPNPSTQRLHASTTYSLCQVSAPGLCPWSLPMVFPLRSA